MKTKTILKTLAVALLMPAMLLTTACSSDDNIIDSEKSANTKGYALPVTVNVTRQGDEPATRATYNESTCKLSFSAGDKLFVKSMSAHAEAGQFAGTLDYDAVSGKFSGTVTTQNEYTGTIDALMASAYAVLLPAGYGSYEFFSVSGSGSDATVSFDYTKAFALTKAAAVEQFSVEYASSYSSGFALTPQNAIVNFTISGLTANTEVAVLFIDNYASSYTPVNVMTDASGVATFAAAMPNSTDFYDYSLTVDGNPIALPENKVVEAGHIYNISRSVVLSAATAEDIGKVVGADGKIYADVDAAQAAGTTACAIIAYVGSVYVGGETGEASPYNHGLAIAMKDAAADYLEWKTSSGSYDNPNHYDDLALAIAAKESGSVLSSGRNNSTWPAFEAALAYSSIDVTDGISAVAPAGTSGWFLPSLYQWNMIVQGLSGQSADLSVSSNDDYNASSLNTKIEAAGGTGLLYAFYCSSTEYDSDNAWLFDAGGGYVDEYEKDYGGYVRAVFAF